MNQQEILALPAEDVYRRVAELLWPWNELRCRNCGALFSSSRGCTKEKCSLDWPGLNAGLFESEELPSWSGVGRMVEAMIERGFEPMMNYWTEDECEPEEGPLYEWAFIKAGNAPSSFNKYAWEAVARACLLALAESEAGK